MNKIENLVFASDFQRQDSRRKELNRLAGQVFDGLDFEPWYQLGGWGPETRPFAFFQPDGQAAACMLAIGQKFWLAGRQWNTVQLGTVATASAWRGQGLGRALMERVLAACQGAEMVYLYANCQAAGFYHKMGFRQARYYRYSLPGQQLAGLESAVPPLRRLDLDNAQHRARLEQLYRQGDLLAEPGCRGDGWGIFLFHCLRGWRRHLYEIPDWDTVLLVRRRGMDLFCGGILGGQGRDLRQLLAAMGEDYGRVDLGFTPADKTGLDCRLLEEPDTLLFVRGENLFETDKLETPVTSRT